MYVRTDGRIDGASIYRFFSTFQMYIEDRLNIRFSQTLKLFLQAGLVFIALLCGVDRIIDNKHHPSDVVAGFVLGIVVAVFVVNMIF